MKKMVYLLCLLLAFMLNSEQTALAENCPPVDTLNPWICEYGIEIFIDCTPETPNLDCIIWFDFCYRVIEENGEVVAREISVQSWGYDQDPSRSNCGCIIPEQQILLAIFQTRYEELEIENTTGPFVFSVFEAFCWENVLFPVQMSSLCEESMCCEAEYLVKYKFIWYDGVLTQLADTVLLTDTMVPLDSCESPCVSACTDWFILDTLWVPVLDSVIAPKIGIYENTMDNDSYFYPNPTTDKVTIELSQKPEEYIKVLVSTNDGKYIEMKDQIHYNETQIILDFTKLPQGTYVFKIVDKHKVISQGKIIYNK